APITPAKICQRAGTLPVGILTVPQHDEKVVVLPVALPLSNCQFPLTFVFMKKTVPWPTTCIQTSPRALKPGSGAPPPKGQSQQPVVKLAPMRTALSKMNLYLFIIFLSYFSMPSTYM